MSADDPFDVEELLEAPYKKQVRQQSPLVQQLCTRYGTKRGFVLYKCKPNNHSLLSCSVDDIPVLCLLEMARQDQAQFTDFFAFLVFDFCEEMVLPYG